MSKDRIFRVGFSSHMPQAEVTLDGELVTNVERVTIDIEPGEMPRVTLTLFDVEIDVSAPVRTETDEPSATVKEVMGNSKQKTPT